MFRFWFFFFFKVSSEKRKRKRERKFTESLFPSSVPHIHLHILLPEKISNLRKSKTKIVIYFSQSVNEIVVIIIISHHFYLIWFPEKFFFFLLSPLIQLFQYEWMNEWMGKKKNISGNPLHWWLNRKQPNPVYWRKKKH